MNKLIKEYPAAYAIYDLGKYYGVANSDERFCFVDKNSLKTVSVRMRYEKEVLDAINKAVPIWFAEDDD